MTAVSELPKHTPEATSGPAPRRARGRLAGVAPPLQPAGWWLWTVLVLFGAALIIAPIRLGMFQDTAEGEALVRNFTPILTEERLDRLTAQLAVLDSARAEVVAQGVPPADPDYANTEAFLVEYPKTQERFQGWIAVMRANSGTFEQFKSLPPFGVFPFVFFVSGLALVVVGLAGLAGRGSKRVLKALASLVGVGLIVFPLTTGLFSKAPNGTKLLADFGPILTAEQADWAQDQFLVLGPAVGELETSYVPKAAGADPPAVLPATKALLQQWPRISNEFAQLVGALSDNAKHFQALQRLNSLTKPLGFGAFDEFGWFYFAPGAVIALLLAVDALINRRRS